MPVRLDDVYPEISEIPDTTRSLVVALLYNYPEFGYRAEEVKDHLNLSHGSATVCLKHLYDQGYVEKTEDGYYYAAEDREDLHEFVVRLDELTRIFTPPTEAGYEPNGEAEKAIQDAYEDPAIEEELAELQRKIS